MWYSIYNLHETIEEFDNKFIIDFIGPLLNSSGLIIGYIQTKNTYTLFQGTTFCETDSLCYIYNEVHDVDYKTFGKNNKYIPNNNVIGTLGTSFKYQGTLSQSKFITGTVSNILTRREGKTLPQTFAPVSIIVRGRVDGIRLMTCNDLVHLIPSST